MEHRCHLREIVDRQQSNGAEPGRRHAAAIDEHPLAEDVEVTCLVHELCAEEELRFEVVGVDRLEKAARNVAGDELDLGEERAQRAHGLFDVVGLVADGVPGDVAGRGPLALQGFLVEQHRGFGPHVALVPVLSRVSIGARVGLDPARRERPPVPLVNCIDASHALVD